MFKDYYQILGIPHSASKQEIRRAYRDMSLKWHPDRNPDKDVTEMMQDINEAYSILYDDISRSRYNIEYKAFTQQKESRQSKQYETKEESWNYDYDVKDENLREDINAARAKAKDLVDEFLKNLKETSKVAAKGGWDGAKGYVYAAIIMTIAGICIRGCMEIQEQNSYSDDDWQSKTSIEETVALCEESVSSVDAFQIPEKWTKYYVAHKSFSISVPPTVELRHEYDRYVKSLQSIGLSCNTDDIVFEQKDLSVNSSQALSRYCRIMIQYQQGNEGDFPLANETFPLDNDAKAELHNIVDNELGLYQLIGEPSYQWINIRDIRAIETTYRRTGSNQNTTSCRMYLLFNDDEMVKMIVSYREQEKDFWLPDLTNVIKTFEWKE